MFEEHFVGIPDDVFDRLMMRDLFSDGMAGDRDLSDTYTDVRVSATERSYMGPLGRFVYDSRVFKLTRVSVGSNVFPVMLLRYIGRETDGKNIRIPKGILSCMMMFAGSGVTIAPAVPDGVVCTFGMFSDCRFLGDASQVFNSNNSVRDVRFMFSGCTKLLRGPFEIPETVVNADYMFAGCSNLMSAPKMKVDGNMVSVEGMFINCSGINKVPVPPIHVVWDRGYDDGANGSKKASDSRRPFLPKLGRDFKSGIYGFVERSAIDADLDRAACLIGDLVNQGDIKGAVAGVCSVYNASLPGDISFFVDGLTSEDGASAEMNVEDFAFVLADKISSASAQRLENRYRGCCDARERMLMQVLRDAGDGMSDLRAAVSEYYIREIAAAVVYYKVAHDMIRHTESGASHSKMIFGLWNVVRWIVFDIFSSALSMHGNYDLFVGDQLYQIDELISYLPKQCVD